MAAPLPDYPSPPEPSATTAPPGRPLRVLFSVEVAAEELSISRTRMYQLLKTGRIESVKVGRLRRIPAEALAGYVRRLIAEQCASAKQTIK